MSDKPRLLDTFCKAGGATKGYQRAGFEVVGVDIEPQPHYCGDAFILADALDVLYALAHGDCWPDQNGRDWHLEDFDGIHASPPCFWTRAGKLREAQGYQSRKPELLAPTRTALERLTLPWVIENVPGAPMRRDLVLCGSMFGLRVRRHRWFESNMTMSLVSPCNHVEQGRPVGVYHRMNDEIPSGGRTAKSLTEAQEAMGIDWMIWDELKEAIPPAYTEFIGKQLLQAIRASQSLQP